VIKQSADPTNEYATFKNKAWELVGEIDSYDDRTFFFQVMAYIVTICRSKGDAGVLFLLDEFKAMEKLDKVILKS